MSNVDAPLEYEIGVSYRYAQEHGWVVHAITGFLSAYYMEDIRFRMKRHVHELETGMYVWTSEAPSEKFMERLLKRLQQDVPPFQLRRRGPQFQGTVRFVIDLSDETETEVIS